MSLCPVDISTGLTDLYFILQTLDNNMGHGDLDAERGRSPADGVWLCTLS